MSAEARSERRPAVFLDRDGTLNRELDYLSDPEQFELLPGVAPALRALAEAGFALVVVTNQSGVARGLFSETRLLEIHRRMQQLLCAQGVQLDGIEYCPHHPQVGGAAYRRNCTCRKPLPGMLERAALTLGLELGASWIIGDSWRDLEAGEHVGARGILVRTGKGAEQERQLEARGARMPIVVDDLAAAGALILSDAQRTSASG